MCVRQEAVIMSSEAKTNERITDRTGVLVEVCLMKHQEHWWGVTERGMTWQ